MSGSWVKSGISPIIITSSSPDAVGVLVVVVVAVVVVAGQCKGLCDELR